MHHFLSLSLLLVVATAPPQKDESHPQSHWENELRAFETWDCKNSVPRDAVLFVGSSSIRLWCTRSAFPGLPVINRGFGGSQMSDLVDHFDRVIKPYQPRIAVIYSGDNDVASGRSPERIDADLAALLGRFAAVLPQTRVIVLAIKPSPSRWEHWSRMRDANSKMRETCASRNATFLDFSAEMLGPNGEPRPELYVDDKLHLSPAGYALWTLRLRPHLDAFAAPPTTRPARAP